MKFFMRVSALLLLMATAISAVGYFFWYKPAFEGRGNHFTIRAKAGNVAKTTASRLKEKATGLRAFIQNGNYNDRYCFLIDMSIHPGKKRFFVYNIEKDSAEAAGLVTHGSGSERSDTTYFSNEPGSNCTSLGRYKIGHAYQGKFGAAYKLYGLDKSNSNAFNRFVVLHAHACVPSSEVYPLSICESLGCPTVSPGFLQTLNKYIDAIEKPIVLSIYK